MMYRVSLRPQSYYLSQLLKASIESLNQSGENASTCTLGSPGSEHTAREIPEITSTPFDTIQKHWKSLWK